MQSATYIKAFVAVIALVVAGSFVGILFGDSLRGRIYDSLASDAPSDPVERYELGRDSFNKGRVKVDPKHNIQMRNDATEFGVVRDGARVLVPYEPARAKDRAEIMAQQEWQNYTYPAIENPDSFHYYDTTPRYRTRESRGRAYGSAEAETAALNRQQAAKAAADAGLSARRR